MQLGRMLPEVIFKTRVRDENMFGDNPYCWKDMTTSDYFGEGRHILFSLPGAFTPTCDTYQLPNFEKLAPKFKEMGIGEIYCMSVNDAFVMNSWAKTQDLKYVKVIPDGTGEFTRAMGMLVNKPKQGFGLRSWRYAAIINRGMIESWFEEPGINNESNDDDPYIETTPESILDFISYEDWVPESKRIVPDSVNPHKMLQE